MIKDKLENAVEIYVFEIQLCDTTLRQWAPFTPMWAKDTHKFTSEVAVGDHNNSARHLYNIVKNPKYNLWTDPTTGNGYNANNYGWHSSLMEAVG